jgi:uncharacterized protein
MKKYVIKTGLVVLLSLALLGLPKFGRLIANLFNLSKIDPDGAFMWISIHHIAQAALFLLIMFLFSRFKSIDFKLGIGDPKIGFAGVKKFMLFFSLYTLGAFLSIVFAGGFERFQYPLNARNIIGYLGFQLLLSGPSEEIIFRAFAITMFGLIFSKRIFKGKISIANIYAAIIFGLAHIYFAFSPWEISYSIFQVFYAMALGIFYGDVYEKSGSVIYPMMMHSFSNVLMIGVTVILSYIL